MYLPVKQEEVEEWVVDGLMKFSSSSVPPTTTQLLPVLLLLAERQKGHWMKMVTVCLSVADGRPRVSRPVSICLVGWCAFPSTMSLSSLWLSLLRESTLLLSAFSYLCVGARASIHFVGYLHQRNISIRRRRATITSYHRLASKMNDEQKQIKMEKTKKWKKKRRTYYHKAKLSSATLYLSTEDGAGGP